MLRFILKVLIGVIQIPLTIIYFVMSFIGGLVSGAGWIVGIVVFTVTGICWLFGQFSEWYQPMIGILIAAVFTFAPSIITDAGENIVLKIKGMLNTIC